MDTIQNPEGRRLAEQVKAAIPAAEIRVGDYGWRVWAILRREGQPSRAGWRLQDDGADDGGDPPTITRPPYVLPEADLPGVIADMRAFLDGKGPTRATMVG